MQRAQARVEELESYKPDPYFCRIEVSVEGGEPCSYCIGERPLADAGQPVVLDWRSPLGRTHASKTQTQFKVASPNGGDERVYDLHLRRMVHIQDARLVGVSTEFDGADASLDGEVVDPFLLSILRDKRRSYRLSNIVRTIQESQNAILERPFDESFVVQGCAGSGKTMILLHRLSYLAFNHPEVDFSKYLVLTPSESFNKQVDELCGQLEIEQVPRLTVEAYYERIVSQLSRADVFYETDSQGRARKAMPKVRAQSAELTHEDSLNHGFLSEVYSTAFLEEVAEGFLELTGRVLDELKESGACELFERCGFEPLASDAAPYGVYRGLATKCEKTRGKMEGSASLIEEKRRQLDEAEQELLRFKASQDASRAALSPLRERAVVAGASCVKEARAKLASLQEGRVALSKGISSASEQRDSLAQGVQRLASDHELARSEVTSAEAAFERISVSVSDDDPEVVRRVAAACQAETFAIRELEEEYAKVGVFNLGKCLQIRKEMDEAKKVCEATREAVKRAIEEELIEKERASQEERIGKLREQEQALGEQLSDAQARLDGAEQQLAESNAKLRKTDVACSKLEAFANDVDSLVAQFEGADLPILQKDVLFANLEKVAPDLAAYIKACSALSLNQRRDVEEGQRGLEARENRYALAKGEFEAEERAVFNEGDKGILTQAELLRDELDVRAFGRVLSRRINALAARHMVGRFSSAHYRHELYAQAVLCLFCYGAPSTSGACACIDEAQDLSPAEHTLIRASLGADAVVNLYGDVNQLVYPYKGLAVWEQLGDGLPAGRFELRENYRNTVQVVDYSNAELGMEVTAVGLDGPAVEAASLEEALVSLLELRAEREGLRCAVVCSPRCKEASESVISLLGVDASAGAIVPGKVAVLPVGLSKGLEFDAVVVVENEMTENERYVAFTRSLETLIVTKV